MILPFFFQEAYVVCANIYGESRSILVDGKRLGGNGAMVDLKLRKYQQVQPWALHLARKIYFNPSAFE